ncbi:MAG: L-histidine N(alpha)-methyltransferase, partial [Longimicrobiales bacterium]|nr:L-histidine N(alpha)-methyltransferase [Longimicrobiales bacterium]
MSGAARARIPEPVPDETAEARAIRDEIWAGLNRSQKVISSRFFYDTRGSQLFEAITRLPEYYPTRTERALLTEWSDALVER